MQIALRWNEAWGGRLLYLMLAMLIVKGNFEHEGRVVPGSGPATIKDERDKQRSRFGFWSFKSLRGSTRHEVQVWIYP